MAVQLFCIEEKWPALKEQAALFVAREKPLTNGILLVFLQGSIIQKILEHILLICMRYNFHLFQARGLS